VRLTLLCCFFSSHLSNSLGLIQISLIGTSHPQLANLIARRLGLQLGSSSIVTLPSGELSLVFFLSSWKLPRFHPLTSSLFVLDCSVTFHESVREADVYIVATASGDETGTNGALMELVPFFSLYIGLDTQLTSTCSLRLCIMAHTLRIASARRITAVV